jgi:2-polyprenyl-6-methoxyphenol hydroxylase-like FAD-dependent oxidoreductase
MKVLIVGAGIAGPTLAYWLLRAGHQPTLVDRAPELRRGGYLIDFWGAGFDVAERMGIISELNRRGYRLREARTVTKGGRRIASFPSSVFVDAAGERYLSIMRSDLAEVIYGALQDRADLILDDTAAALKDDGDRVRVTFESGPTRDFDLVVGADGLHSRVRRLVFGPEQEFEKYLGIVVAAFDVRGYRPRDDGIAMMHAEIGFQVMRLALRDDVTMFLLAARHSGGVPTEMAGQQALLRERLRHAGWETTHRRQRLSHASSPDSGSPAILDLMPQARTFYFDRVSQIRMPFWTRGRVALVGDAAACPSLLAGQGSALAMVESYVLAAELARTKGDHDAAFARYEQRLGGVLRSKQDAAEGLGLAFAPRSALQLLIRNTMMRLIALPHVADLAVGKSLRDAVELPSFAAA